MVLLVDTLFTFKMPKFARLEMRTLRLATFGPVKVDLSESQEAWLGKIKSKPRAVVLVSVTFV